MRYVLSKVTSHLHVLHIQSMTRFNGWAWTGWMSLRTWAVSGIVYKMKKFSINDAPKVQGYGALCQLFCLISFLGQFLQATFFQISLVIANMCFHK